MFCSDQSGRVKNGLDMVRRLHVPSENDQTDNEYTEKDKRLRSGRICMTEKF